MAKDVKTLGDLREVVGLTQVSLSEKLGISQSEISRVEKRPNYRIETLRKYVEQGLGGELTIGAIVKGADGKLHWMVLG